MDLVSIAPATKTVPLGRGTVQVTGLSMRKIRDLDEVFPNLRSFVFADEFDVGLLLAEAPNIALGLFSQGYVGPARFAWWRRSAALISNDDLAKARQAFDRAPAGQQIEILGAIFDLTMKGSDRVLPFLRQIFAPAKIAPLPSEILSESTPASSPT